MNRYRRMLKDERWSQRRNEIMRRDGYRCRRCGANGKLNVHHKRYIYGRHPWQYPDSNLITLCENCHRRVHLIQDIRYAVTILLMILAAYLMYLHLV